MTNGVVYIVFGENARKCCEESLASLRKFNPTLQVAVVGDELAASIPGVQHIQWTLEDPFNATMPTRFQFMAGRVKPRLYDISPFEKTLYIDADTEFQQNIMAGFNLLDCYDVMFAKHSSHTAGMLNKNPSKERLATVTELSDGDVPYPNSGVIFWKKSPGSERVFNAWYSEWSRFHEWDEQLALMRAVYKNPCRVLLLPQAWNGENKKEGLIIFHDFHGEKAARSDATLERTFTQIHDTHYWASKESVSGPGSDTQNTEHIREMLPFIIHSFGVKTLLDAGCGDWNWMSKLDLSGIEYHGCDIVPALIEKNKEKYPGQDFILLDLTLPINFDEITQNPIDLILCRSVLFHLSFANVAKVIKNFHNSQATWLLATTYPYYDKENNDIQNGHWHRINLEKPPFNFPVPHLLIPEGQETDGWLGLWKVKELP